MSKTKRKMSGAIAGPPTQSNRPWFRVSNAADTDAVTVEIYDQIGKDWWTGDGVAAKEFLTEWAKIPRNKAVQLRLNSPGGSVHDGLTIYNRLVESRDRIDVIIDGVACSIASVIALCGRTLKMPGNTMLMIHNPWAVAQGTSKEMRECADVLDKHRDSLVTIYQQRTGKTPEDLKSMMDAETWMLAKEAKDNGFATEVLDEQVSVSACFDLSVFGRAPEQLVKNIREASMNKKQLLARLKQLGVQAEETETIEALKAKLDAAEAEAKAKGGNASNMDPAESSSSEEEMEMEDKKAKAKDSKKQPEAKAAPAAPQAQSAEVIALQKQVAVLTAKAESERKHRIERDVDACIAQDRIPANQRDKWIARALADESVISDLQNMEPRSPGVAALGITINAEDPRDIERGFKAMRQPISSYIRGNSVAGEVLSNKAIEIAKLIQGNRKRIDQILATNTVDSELKRNVILSDMMRAFKKRLVQLNVFSTTFTNIPLQGNNKVIVPFFELDTTASKDWVAADGYVFDQDTSAGQREITINKRKYKPMEYTSDELARQPYFNPPMSLILKAEQLAIDVWTDILSAVTVANFGGSVLRLEPGTFDVDDIITLRKIAQDNDWPDVGRALVLGTEAEAALLADEGLKAWQNSNSTDPLREGATGRLVGFETFFSPRIPTNSEDLQGFICLPPAMIVATSPIAPAPAVRNQLVSYDLVVDPGTGMAFEYRSWGEPNKDKQRETIECNYGYAKGNASALKRIDAGATIFSSSSSQSSSSSS